MWHAMELVINQLDVNLSIQWSSSTKINEARASLVIARARQIFLANNARTAGSRA
jgi:hypothetical protein